MRKDFWRIEYALLVFVIFSALVVFFKVRNTDIDYCRKIFNGLAQGRPSVAKLIDWQNLKALDEDIGADYRQLPDEGQRQLYRRVFIRSFALGFQQAGARPKHFLNWRLYSRESGKITVATDQIGKNREIIKTILLTVSLYPERKLVFLQGYVAPVKTK